MVDKEANVLRLTLDVNYLMNNNFVRNRGEMLYEYDHRFGREQQNLAYRATHELNEK